MPSWQDLLGEAAARCGVTRLYCELRIRNDAYKIADRLQENLGRPVLDNTIREIVKNHQRRIVNKTAPLLYWTLQLGQLGNCGILTTNWDTLLHEITGYRLLSWPQDSQVLLAYLRTATPFVLHLHGHIRLGDLVVSSADCSRVRQSLKDEMLPMLPTILAGHRLIVLGSGFPDEHINEMIETAAQLCGPRAEQLVIVMRSEEEKAFRKRLPGLASRATFVKFTDFEKFRSTIDEAHQRADPSRSLIAVPSLQRPVDIAAVVATQPYTYLVTRNLRDLLKGRRDRGGPFLGIIATHLIDTHLSENSLNGIGATLLSTELSSSWHPQPKTLKRLSDAVLTTLVEETPDKISIVEPLAFALGAKGRTDVHREYLFRVIQHLTWRRADMQRLLRYYGPQIVELLNAIKRHLRTDLPVGLLKVNDLGRLLSVMRTFNDQGSQSLMRQLLVASMTYLRNSSEHELLRAIVDELRVIETDLNPMLHRKVPVRN